MAENEKETHLLDSEDSISVEEEPETTQDEHVRSKKDPSKQSAHTKCDFCDKSFSNR
jgi:hypothetical protein